jgi:hypothetical protein
MQAYDIGSSAGELVKALYAAATREQPVIDLSGTEDAKNKERMRRLKAAVLPSLEEYNNVYAAREDEAKQRRHSIFDRGPGETIKEDAAKDPAMSRAMVSRGISPEARASYDVGKGEISSKPDYYDDLPDHERGLVDKGVSPAEAALHLIPHVRAGAEAAKRGEDYWGGTDQFERERNALQQFYRLADADARAATATPSPKPTPRPKATPAPALSVPPASDDAEDDTPLGRLRGGRVNRKAVHGILAKYAR